MTNGQMTFRQIAQVVIRYRIAVLVGSFLVLLGMFGAIATRLQVDTSLDSFAEQGSQAQKVLTEYRDEFGRDGLYVVVVEGDVFSVPFLEKLKALHQEVQALELDLPSLKTAGQPATSATTDNPNTILEKDGDDTFAFVDDDDDFDEFEASSDEPLGRLVMVGNVASDVMSLINARHTQKDEQGTLVVGKKLEPFPTTPEGLNLVKKRVLGDPTLVGRLVGSAGQHTVVALKTPIVSEEDSARIYFEVVAIAEKFNAENFKTLVGGTPALNASLNALLMTDLRRMLILSVFTMLALLIYLFRHLLAVIGALYVVFYSAVTMVGTLALLGIPLTMMSNILPAFLFCVGIGHAVHLISVYRDARSELEGSANERTERALVKALETTGVPIFFTSITTMVGLLSFGFASIRAIQEMGMAGAYAVFVAFLCSITLLPALLSFHKNGSMGRKDKHSQDFIDRFLELCNAASGLPDDSGTGTEPLLARRRRITMLIVNALLVSIMVWSAAQLTVWHNPISWIPEGESIRKAFDTLDANVGGTANVQLLIEGKKGEGLGKGMRDHELIEALATIEKEIKAFEHSNHGKVIGTSTSLLDVIRESQRVLVDAPEDVNALPKDDRGVSDMLFMFENAGPEEIKRLATSDLSTSQMTLQIKWLEASEFRELTPFVDAVVEKHTPEGTKIRATGAVYTLVNTIGNLIMDLLSSFGLAFVVVTLLMVLLLGSLKLGLIAMVPNLMPVAMIMGIMHFCSIPIDMNNILIASISMGLAVDDTIHLLHQFRLNHQRTQNVEESIRIAMSHSGRAMVSTTMILMLGFFVYMGAEMQNIQRFGLLIGLTALLALLIDLFFAPALLRTFYARQSIRTTEMIHEAHT